MAEDPKTPPAQGDTALKIGDIRKLVTDTITEALKGVTTTKEGEGEPASTPMPRGDRTTSIQATVQAELDKIKAKETADKEKADIQTQLTKLSEATAEKAPIERRRVHKLMGWGE